MALIHRKPAEKTNDKKQNQTMNISFSDLTGSVGVFILLLAFVLNLLNKIDKDSNGYILLNIIGAALACYASYLINYVPFIILEGVWTIVSIGALLKNINSKTFKGTPAK